MYSFHTNYSDQTGFPPQKISLLILILFLIGQIQARAKKLGRLQSL